MNDIGHQIVDMGEILFAENIAESREAVCGQIIIFPGSGKEIAEQLPRIQKQIRPVAPGTGSAVSGVGDVTGQDSDITGMEGLFLTVDL